MCEGIIFCVHSNYKIKVMKKGSFMRVEHTPGHYEAKMRQEKKKYICPLCQGEGQERGKHHLCEPCRRDHYEDGDRTGKD